MKFKFESWTVGKLLKLYKSGNLNLNPPYQRNPIWGLDKQKELIWSLKSHSALPAFFVLETGKDKYEIVDGQQRTRALIAYSTSTLLDEKKGVSETFKTTKFEDYPLNVTVITSLGKNQKIEEFYAKINSSGVHLNRPETFKAQYSKTKFLEFVEKLVTRQDFLDLDLITASSKKRMLDRDLVEELVALSIHGITDKKEQVDKMYESDLNDSELAKAEKSFNFAMKIFTSFNKIHSLKNTRYRQRNDFYTLFGYIINNESVKASSFQRFYRILLALEPGIRPDKKGCEPLADYAFNCVSQSNSSRAREIRNDILEQLLGITGGVLSPAQKKVIKYYSVPKTAIELLDNRKVFVPKELEKAVEAIEFGS